MHFHNSFIIEAMSVAVQFLSHLNAFFAGAGIMLFLITFKDDIEQKFFPNRKDKGSRALLMIKLSIQMKKIESAFAEMNNIMDEAEVSMKPTVTFKGKPYKEISEEAYKAVEEKVINAIEDEESDDEIIFDDEGRAHIRSDVMEAAWD